MSRRSEARIYRVMTSEPEEGRWRIRGYYSDRADAEQVASHYRVSEGVESGLAILDLTDVLERDELCHLLNGSVPVGADTEHTSRGRSEA